LTEYLIIIVIIFKQLKFIKDPFASLPIHLDMDFLAHHLLKYSLI